MTADDEHRSIFQNLLNRAIGRRRPYHPYTTQFDVVTDALALDAALGPLKGEAVTLLREALQEWDAGLLSWRTGLQAVAAEIAARLEAALPSEARAATVVTLLFDQSGSMRGRKMILAAAAAEACQELLRTVGVRVEILGFTTVGWHGGESRRQWAARGRPGDPGRLNDLLHIVYRSAADEPVALEREELSRMLRSDMLKENIDGEALEWAIARLRERPEANKLLIVVSDGAPVDDMTLLENGPNYLWDHLKAVIKATQDSPDIRLGAVGLGFEFGDLYARSVIAEDPDELGQKMLSFLETMLVETSSATP
jgi:cobaltochelatase CobT